MSDRYNRSTPQQHRAEHTPVNPLCVRGTPERNIFFNMVRKIKEDGDAYLRAGKFWQETEMETGTKQKGKEQTTNKRKKTNHDSTSGKQDIQVDKTNDKEGHDDDDDDDDDKEDKPIDPLSVENKLLEKKEIVKFTTKALVVLETTGPINIQQFHDTGRGFILNNVRYRLERGRHHGGRSVYIPFGSLLTYTLPDLYGVQTSCASLPINVPFVNASSEYIRINRVPYGLYTIQEGPLLGNHVYTPLPFTLELCHRSVINELTEDQLGAFFRNWSMLKDRAENENIERNRTRTFNCTTNTEVKTFFDNLFNKPREVRDVNKQAEGAEAIHNEQ